jgi:hypothetical protein
MHVQLVMQRFEHQPSIHCCVQVMTTMYLASLPRGRVKLQAQVGDESVHQQEQLQQQQLRCLMYHAGARSI